MSICLAISGVDWSLTKDIVSMIGTIGVLTIGVVGLSTWRKQLLGTSKYQVAKDILTATYRLQDAMQAVRSPMVYLKREEVEAGNQLKEEQRVYSERLRYLDEQKSILRTLALEARAIWGEQGEQCLEKLNALVGTLHAEIWLHFWLKGAYAGSGATVDRNPKRVQANDDVVYWTSGDDNFSKQIASAVQDVEEMFQSKMR